MPRRRETAGRSVGLFLLAVLLFNPPILTLFGGDGTVFGLPLIYVYLFSAWGLVILLISRIAERWVRSAAAPPLPRAISGRETKPGANREP